ncbi:unnamed protein product [Ectocarpus sp. 12 AP-2014]
MVCTARRQAGSAGRVPDPSEVFQTRRGAAMDPHTRLPGYTCSTMLGVTQVWFTAHHVGHVLKTLRLGRLDDLHRRMKRNPHVLDARVCRAVIWWSILAEAMEAAKEAERRRARRRECRRLVVGLAVSQRRSDRGTRRGKTGTHEHQRASGGSSRSGMSRSSSRTWSLPPLTDATHLKGGEEDQGDFSGGGRRAPCHGGAVAAPPVVRECRAVHLDEAAILNKVYEFL